MKFDSNHPTSNFLSGIAGALVGALITGLITITVQSNNLEANRELTVREARRPVYLNFLDAANSWIVAQETRADECKPGTDVPKVDGTVCTVTYLGDLQRARFDLRDAGDEMSLVESATMSRLRDLIGLTYPSAQPFDNGPAEGPVSEEAGPAYSILLNFARCDTNPNPDLSTCGDLQEAMEELLIDAGLATVDEFTK